MNWEILAAVVGAVLALAAITAVVLWLVRERPSEGVAVECGSEDVALLAIRRHLMRALAAGRSGFLVVDEKRAGRFVQFAIVPGTSIELDRPEAGLTRDEWLRCMAFAERNAGEIRELSDDGERTCVVDCGLDAAAAARSAAAVFRGPLDIALPWRLAFESGEWDG